MRLVIIILSVSFLFASCKKWSRSWVVAEVEVVKNGTPIQGKKVYLRYFQKHVLGESTEEVELIGETDQNGFLDVEYKVSRRTTGFSIGVYDTSPYSGLTGFVDQYVHVKKKNIIKIEL